MTDRSWTPDDWFERETSGEMEEPVRVYGLSIDDDPDPATWLEWTEADRVAAIEEAHRFELPDGHPVPGDGWQVHASFHCIIENQLAADDPPAARETLARLRDGGVPRHDAIHALASVVTDHLRAAQAAQGNVEASALERDYRALDPDVWRPE